MQPNVQKGQKSPPDSSDMYIKGQWKNPTDLDSTPCYNEAELASESATSESEKPMEIDHNKHKKCAYIPNNVSIKELTNGSPNTGIPEQK